MTFWGIIISIESPENSTNHSIANEWAIYKWAKELNINFFTMKIGKSSSAPYLIKDNKTYVFDLKEIIEELGLNYIRVSSSTTDTNKTINDEIIGKIKSSKIVIADFTGQRNSVYFEAGLAMGLNIPVIWTCKKDEVENLSFDTRQYPHILWETKEDLKEKLRNRIKAIS